jgi:uncharacterized membrane protein YfcA
MFQAVSPVGVVGLAAVYFVSYLIKGTVGLGGLTPAILFGTFILGPHHSILLALTTNVLTQSQFVPQGIRDGDWSIAKRIVIANFPCAAMGIWIFGRLEGSLLTLFLGVLLGSLVLIDQSDWLAKKSGEINFDSPTVLYGLAAATGLISGIVGGGGLFFLVFYLRYICRDPRTLRGTTLLLAAVLVVWRVSILILAGHIDEQIFVESVVLWPAALLGGFVGTKLFGRLSTKRFYQFFKIVLTLAAIGLVYRSLCGFIQME